MKTGLTLQQLAAKIEGNRALKRDFVVDTSQTTLQVVRSPALVSGEPATSLQLELPGGSGTFPVLETAHDQIGGRTGIPAKYYDRMRAEAPDLLATNVNAWFRIHPERRMARTLGGDLRGFLSDRYQRIEHEEIAEVALPVLADIPGVQVPTCEVTDRRLYIHFVVPTIQGEVKRGDVVRAGGIISNSEIGYGSVSVAGILWRLLCLNGMKTREAFRRNHVGRRVEDDGELDWSDDTRRADDRAVLLKVRDMVRAVVDETRFRANLEKLRGLTEGRVTGDPAKAVEVLAQKVGATDAERGGILRSLIEGADLTRWGVVNAVTAQAHAAASYDRAVELEAIGGKLIDLPRKDWREILEAA